MQHENSQLLGRFTQLEKFELQALPQTDNEILYIHEDLNHPPSMLKQIRTSIEKRISTLSSNETIFN